MISNISKNLYEVIERIGEGGFGIVYKVLDKKNNNYYALKFFPKEKIQESIEVYEKEIEALKDIKNKYIIDLKDYYYDEINKGYCIIMELCDDDLKKILKKDKTKGLSLKIINKIFYQLNEALKAMRNKKYIHRDLKPDNILIKYTDTNKNDFNIKLSDFNFSTNEINSSVKSHSVLGTKKYIAPEIENNKYNVKCDLWSLGVILYELYTNKYIFYSHNKNEQENRKNGKIINETDNEMINR